MTAQPASSVIRREPASDTSAAGPMIELNGVERRFGPVRALGPIDVRIDRGEFVAVVGPSGCGKSTLLELVAGLQAPDAGTVSVNGHLLEGPRRRTSIIFQDSSTLPWRTVEDNVAFALEASGVPKKERRRQARALLRAVGLEQFARHHPPQLSGGMRQRVAIARALSLDPDLILADEPFGALDEQTRILMAFELMQVVDRSSAAVLFITHSIQEAVLLADRILVMGARPGRIVDEIVVDLPRPRDESVLGLPASARITERVWARIRDEARAAMGGSDTEAS